MRRSLLGRDADPGKADDEEDLRESQVGEAEILAKARAVRLDGGLAAANGVVLAVDDRHRTQTSVRTRTMSRISLSL